MTTAHALGIALLTRISSRGNFTYIYTHQGFCHVAFITDVYSGRFLGYTVSRTKQSDFVLDALRQALSVQNRYDAKFSAVSIIHHSDAGFQYTSSQLRKLIEREGITGSLSAPSVMPGITGSWSPLSGCLTARRSTTIPGCEHSPPGKRLNGPPISGSTGTTPNAFTAPSTTSRRSNTRPATITIIRKRIRPKPKRLKHHPPQTKADSGPSPLGMASPVDFENHTGSTTSRKELAASPLGSSATCPRIAGNPTTRWPILVQGKGARSGCRCRNLGRRCAAKSRKRAAQARPACSRTGAVAPLNRRPKLLGVHGPQ